MRHEARNIKNPPIPPFFKGGRGGIILLLASCFLLLSSCSLRKPATAITADTLTRGMIAVESESDVFVARESALSLIKILDVLHYGNPKNKKFLGLLAKAYGNYAFGLAELEGMKGGAEEWISRAKRFYAKGRDYGIAALSTGKTSIAEIPLNKFEKNLKRFSKKDVPTLFWTAFSWGSYINMSRDDIVAAADLPRVQALVDRALELEPEFQCGVTYAFKGALLAGNPFLTGSKPEMAKPYFEKALDACNGAYLMTKVMYAEWYLNTIGDKVAFKKALEEVITADASVLPQQRLANELAKERARMLFRIFLK